MELENLGQPTILLGTSEFEAKARAELRNWGFPDRHFLSVPHGYQELDAQHFAEILEQLVQDIAALLAGRP